MNADDYIYEIYREGSFSGAAKKLFVSQPALSASVRKTEASLGIRIFDRSASPVALTDEGKVYLEALKKIRRIEEETQTRLADLSGLKTGRVVVSGANFVSSFILPQIVTLYLERYPGISLELIESNSPDLKQRFLNEAIDLMIEHNFSADDFAMEELFTETILLAVPSHLPINRSLSACALSGEDVIRGRHLTADCPTVALADFRDEEFIFLHKSNDMYNRGMLLCREAGFTPRVRIYLDQLITSYNLASAGLGIAFAPDMLVRHAQTGECVFYRIRSTLATRKTYIARKKNRYASRACTAFIKTAKEVYSKQKDFAPQR